MSEVGANYVAPLQQLLKTMVEYGGTDLHITTDSAPQIRIDGRMVPLKLPPLDAAQTRWLCYGVMTDQQKHRLEEDLEVDFSFGLQGVARFRANVYNQRGATAGAFRTIPEQIRSFDELGLPPAVQAHHPGGHGGQDQRRRAGAHPDHRGSGGIRPQTQAGLGEPAGDPC